MTDPATDDERLSAFLDGALAPEAAAALARRIAAEPGLAQRLDAMAALKATLSGLDADLPPPPLPARPVGWAGWPRTAAAATAALLAAGLAALIWLPGDPGEAPQVAAHRRFVAAPPDGRAATPHPQPAGLVLERVERVAGGLYAAYRGPHGCRLGVWTGPPEAVPTAAPPGWRVAVRRRGAEAVWVVAEPAMDADRFTALAETLGGAAPGRLLAELAADGVPCRA